MFLDLFLPSFVRGCAKQTFPAILLFGCIDLRRLGWRRLDYKMSDVTKIRIIRKLYVGRVSLSAGTTGLGIEQGCQETVVNIKKIEISFF